MSEQGDDGMGKVTSLADRGFKRGLFGDGPEFPDTGQRGPKQTIENVRALLAHENITVAFNTMRKRTEIRSEREFLPEIFDNASLTYVVDRARYHGLPTSDIQSILDVIGGENPFHPFDEWISSKPWDGEDRLRDLVDTVGTSLDRELLTNLLKRFLLQIVAAVYEPEGGRFRQVLTLQGPQGIGKTRWLRRLVRPEMFLEGHLLIPTDKDSLQQAIEHLLVELGELDGTFRKADQAHLKAVIGRESDVARLPYDRRANRYPRRTVFCASVNSREFLLDTTGSSRWAVIPVTDVDHEHGIDMQQVWAQLHARYQAGDVWWLSAEEASALEGTNAAHRRESAIVGALHDHFDIEDESRELWMTLRQVLEHIGFSRATDAQVSALREELRRICSVAEPRRATRMVDGKRQSGRWWPMPPVRSTTW